MSAMVVAHSILSAATHWTWDPIAAAVLIASAVLYAVGLRTLWARATPARSVRPWEAGSFAAGLATLALALFSPLAWLSEILFSAHMTQHEVLMLIAAPLLVFGRPLHVFLWAFGLAGRQRIGRFTRRTTVAAAWQKLTAPATAFLLHAAALWIWHVPSLFDAAVAHRGVHALQHASFLLTATVFWWGMLHGRYGRMGYGAGVVYVFLTAMHSSVLGALMTVAPSVWYSAYARPREGWWVDPLADQQAAGLLMWIPGGVIFIVFGLALLAAWLGESERRARLGSVARR
jgi:putative membrane protein